MNSNFSLTLPIISCSPWQMSQQQHQRFSSVPRRLRPGSSPTHASETGRARAAQEIVVRDFDISLDGRNLVLEREQERSNVVLLDLPGR